jgi:hypothetical protein
MLGGLDWEHWISKKGLLVFASACEGSGKQEIANSQSQFDDEIHRA